MAVPLINAITEVSILKRSGKFDSDSSERYVLHRVVIGTDSHPQQKN